VLQYAAHAWPHAALTEAAIALHQKEVDNRSTHSDPFAVLKLASAHPLQVQNADQTRRLFLTVGLQVSNLYHIKCSIMGRMTITPPERGLDDEVDPGLPRLPAKLSLGLSERSNEFRRISLTTRTAAHDWIDPGNALHGLDQFKHARADPGSKIEGMRAASSDQHFTREQMCLCQIVDVYVISDRAATGESPKGPRHPSPKFAYFDPATV
jgi:hypothetical protein